MFSTIHGRDLAQRARMASSATECGGSIWHATASVAERFCPAAQKKKHAPPAARTRSYTLAAFLIWFFYTRACIALVRGHLGRLQPQHAKLTFWCLPIAVLVHAVSHFSESQGVAEANFLSSLPGKVLDRSLLLYLGATAR